VQAPPQTDNPATPPPNASTRRVRGAKRDEIYLHARPTNASADTAVQVASAYEALVAALKAEGAGPGHLLTDTVFVRPGSTNEATLLGERGRILAAAGLSSNGPATTIIGQAPLALAGDAAAVEIVATAVLPSDGAGATGTSVDCEATCSCCDCAPGFRGVASRIGTQTHFHAGNLRGSTAEGQDEAFGMFLEAEKLLAAAGLSFRDVVRTWIYLRDIDRDYDALNRARREFFTSRGIERKPASTGVQGIPLADAHDFSMSLLAVRGGDSLEISAMSTPLLNEAWTYGADFSRGLRLVEEDKVSLIVSGTASIDEQGHSLHDGDLDRQAERMLDNIATLLEVQRAGFADIVSAVTYVRDASDAPALHGMLGARGFGGFPLAVVEAPLCRPELLCETEVLAALPLRADTGTNSR
jgi:enamine deaminase RidA (YjgF/YER057c/UK114 family)